MKYVEFHKRQELMERGDGEEVNFIKENALAADLTHNVL